MRYKFWFEVNIPNENASDEEVQSLFQNVANAIQSVCPLQIFSEVFFIFLFFSFLVVSLVEREAKRKRKKKTGHRFLKEECQLALLSFSKAGAKVRTLKHNFQMFPEVFFHFSFPKPKFRKKPMAKKRKMEAYRSVLLSECQNIAAFVPESGCKSRAFTDICKIYTSFF